jgi:hypothetical protein
MHVSIYQAGKNEVPAAIQNCASGSGKNVDYVLR